MKHNKENRRTKSVIFVRFAVGPEVAGLKSKVMQVEHVHYQLSVRERMGKELQPCLSFLLGLTIGVHSEIERVLLQILTKVERWKKLDSVLRLLPALCWSSCSMSSQWRWKSIPCFIVCWMGLPSASSPLPRELKPQIITLPSSSLIYCQMWLFAVASCGTEALVMEQVMCSVSIFLAELCGRASPCEPCSSHEAHKCFVSFLVHACHFHFMQKMHSGYSSCPHLNAKAGNNAVLNIVWLCSICTKVISCNCDLIKVTWFWLLFTSY